MGAASVGLRLTQIVQLQPSYRNVLLIIREPFGRRWKVGKNVVGGNGCDAGSEAFDLHLRAISTATHDKQPFPACKTRNTVHSTDDCTSENATDSPGSWRCDPIEAESTAKLVLSIPWW